MRLNRRRLAKSRGTSPWLAMALTASVVTLGGAASGAAQDERASVRIDGRAVLRVGPEGSEPSAARAVRIERRLAAILDSPAALAPARIQSAGPLGEDRAVTLIGVPVVTVSRSDADDNFMPIDDLAARWARALDAALEEARGRRRSKWSRFRAEVQGAVTAAFARLLESAIVIVPRALAALVVIGLFWSIAVAARAALRVAFRRVISDLTLESLVKQIAWYAIWALGLAVAVDALGFEGETVAAGLGVTGLALGFALKDVLSNFVSGLLILTTRPFRIGDEVVVGETEGRVERIELRATQIRTYGGRLVLVPNAQVFTSRVTNNTASPVRRARVIVRIGYDTDLRSTIAISREAALSTPGVLQEPTATVRLRDLGPDDLVLEVRFWTDSRRSDFVATKSAVRTALLEAFSRAGIDLPDPSRRSVVIRGGSDPGALR